MMLRESLRGEGGQRGYSGGGRCRVTSLWDLGKIGLVLVSGKSDSKHSIWKEILEEHHYLHSAKLYGQQIKYLIESEEEGWIGAMSFSSASWKVKPRDERLDWDEDMRMMKLKKVNCKLKRGAGGCYGRPPHPFTPSF